MKRQTMASPESLCLVFGRRLPKDVADIIFEYGFHLWLSRPHDVVTQLDMEYGTHAAWGTMRVVTKGDLSERARELVNFDEYRDQIEQPLNAELFILDPARPRVWPPGVLLWMYPYWGSKELWPVPGLPSHYCPYFEL
jgi:hypothetical protein